MKDLKEPSQILKLKRESTIRAFDFDPIDGRIFVIDYDLGDVYFYRTQVPLNPKNPVELVAVVKGPQKARVVKYWRERNELYIGCAEGKMSIIEIAHFNNGPICKFF